MSEAAIEVRNLSINFGRYTALGGLTFSIPAGGFLAVIGPNGAGKTTLIKAMTGLIKPTKGYVKLLGLPAGEHDPRTVSYVPQIKGFDRRFPALAVELVASGMQRKWPWFLTRKDRDEALVMMERLAVAELAEKSVSELSGGQLQRVYLARGLVRRPKLIILDEPATGMDVPGEAKLYILLEEYQRESGATVVMITHDWTVAAHHASHVLLLNRIAIGIGEPSEVLTEDRLASAFGHAGHRHPMSLGGHEH